MLLHGDEFGPATDESASSGVILPCDDASRPVVRYGSEKSAAMATELDGKTALAAQCCTEKRREGREKQHAVCAVCAVCVVYAVLCTLCVVYCVLCTVWYYMLIQVLLSLCLPSSTRYGSFPHVDFLPFRAGGWAWT